MKKHTISFPQTNNVELVFERSRTWICWLWRQWSEAFVEEQGKDLKKGRVGDWWLVERGVS